MKIWQKIFLGVLLVVVLSTAILGSLQIYENHKENLEREQERSRREIDLYIGILENAMNTMKNTETLIAWYNIENAKRGISFIVYDQEDSLVVHGKLAGGLNGNAYKNTLLASPGAGHKSQLVAQTREGQYLLTSCRMTDEEYPVLMYARDISDIYQQRQNSIRQILTIFAFTFVITGLLAGFLAKYITRPLEKLKGDVEKMQEGKYVPADIKGKDELSDLRRSFSDMAITIATREEELSCEVIAKRDFVAAMTHEMNTPLTSIQGYAHFLNSANYSPEQQMLAVENLEKEAKRMRAMYEKLRQIHLLEGGEVAYEEINLAQLVAHVCEELRPILQDKNIQLDINLQRLIIYSDQTMLHMVISNFLRNAINASKENAKILIQWEKRDEHAIMRIQDWGCGIPKKQIGRVTEPFYRVDKSRSRATGGTGLGLYLCKQMIDKLEGKLEIQSQEKVGTTIILTLPCKEME